MLCPLCVVCIVDPDASVAITDGPVPPLSFGCWFETLTDTLCPLCLSTQLVHVGLHCPLTGGVIGSGVVDEESAVVLFDHGSSIRGQVGRMGQRLDTASGVTVSSLWTRTQRIGSPPGVTRQIIISSPSFMLCHRAAIL